ncbi:MAG: hypothetical protein AAF628_19735 [Planctomycetota bacterium]
MKLSAILPCTALAFVAASVSAQTPLFDFNGDLAGDRAGWSVASAGDVNGDGIADMIIGVPQEDDVRMNSGSARLIDGATGTELWRRDGQVIGDQAGFAVAGVGDANGDGTPDVVIGIPGIDPNNRGQAVVLSGDTGALIRFHLGDGPFDVFGSAVAAAGDVDNDGFFDYVVGAPEFPGGAPGPGYARVFSGVDGSVLYTFAGDAVNDNFGAAVGSADVNGDCNTDIIVGAFLSDPIGPGSGGVRVFSGADGSVLHDLVGDSSNDQLGASVAGIGDVNGDNMEDFVAGAPGDDNLRPDAGMIRVYSGADGTTLWQVDGRLVGGGLGESVASAGDADGDGIGDVIAGAPRQDIGGVDSGAAYVHNGVDGARLCAVRGENAGDLCGWSVATGGDATLDGLGEWIVGCIGASSGAGTARVFVGRNCTYASGDSVSPTTTNAQFGFSAANAGDIDNDGVDDYIVGALLDSAFGMSRNGSAFVFSGVDDTIRWVFRGAASGDALGFSVGAAGDVDGDNFDDLIVGAVKDGVVATAAGAVRVISGQTGNDIYTVRGELANDEAGSSVIGLGDVNGDTVPDFGFGAIRGDANGNVRVISGADGTTELYRSVGDNVNDWFGFSLANIGDVNGDTVNDFAVGAPQFRPTPSGRGYVSVRNGVDGTELYRVTGDSVADAMGRAVAGIGDINGDTVPDFAAGAHHGDINGNDSGYMRAYSGVDGSQLFQVAGAAGGDELGRSIAGIGDATGDGVPDILVGAPLTDSGGLLRSGAAFLISGADGPPAVQGFAGSEAVGEFGHALLGLGDRNGDNLSDVVITAHLQDADAIVDSGESFRVSSVPALDPGRFTVFAAGCPGSSGAQPYGYVTGDYTLGGVPVFWVRAAPPATIVVFLLGVTPSALPLAALGAPGCFLNINASIFFPGGTDITGKLGVPTPLPLVPAALVGGTIFQQWAVVDIPANPLGVTFSNGVTLTIGSGT